jgi:hypothetical protein
MKYIFSDLDNTLLFSGEIKNEDLNAIKNWKKQGNKFVIATGRGVNMMDIIFEKYPDLADYYILNNGALILDKDKNKIEENIMDIDVARSIIADIDIDKFLVAVETENTIYSIGDFQDDICPEVGEKTIQIEVEEINQNNMNIIFLNCSPKDKNLNSAIEIYDNLSSKYKDKISIFRNKHWIDMIPLNLSKGSGIKKLEKLEKFIECNVFVIGDSLNDISMFEYFENSYTFNYAEEIVKEKSKFVVNGFHEMVDSILDKKNLA